MPEKCRHLHKKTTHLSITWYKPSTLLTITKFKHQNHRIKNKAYIYSKTELTMVIDCVCVGHW